MADFPIFLTPQFGGDIQPLAIQFKPLDFSNLMKSVKATKPSKTAKDKKDSLDFGAGTHGYNYQQKELYEQGDQLKRNAMRKYGDAAINTPEYSQGVRMQEMATSEAVLTEKKRILEHTNTNRTNIKDKKSNIDLNRFFNTNGQEISTFSEILSSENENAVTDSLPFAARQSDAKVFNWEWEASGSDYTIEDASKYANIIFDAANNQNFSTTTVGNISEQIAALGGLAFPYLEQKSFKYVTDKGPLSNAMQTVFEQVQQGNYNNELLGGLMQGYVQGLKKNNGKYNLRNFTREDQKDKNGNITEAGKVTSIDSKVIDVLGEDGFVLTDAKTDDGKKYKYNKNFSDGFSNYVRNFVEQKFYERYNTSYAESNMFKTGPRSGDGLYKKKKINEIYSGSSKLQSTQFYMRTPYSKKPETSEDFVSRTSTVFQQFGYPITENAFEVTTDRMKDPKEKESFYYTYNKPILQNNINKLDNQIVNESNKINDNFYDKTDDENNLISSTDYVKSLLGIQPSVNIVNQDKSGSYMDITKIPNIQEEYPMVYSLASNLDENTKQKLQQIYESKQNQNKSDIDIIKESFIELKNISLEKSKNLRHEINALNNAENESYYVGEWDSQTKLHTFKQSAVNELNEEITKNNPKAKDVGTAVNIAGTWMSPNNLVGTATSIEGTKIYEVMGYQADNFKEGKDGWGFYDINGTLTAYPTTSTDNNNHYKTFSKKSYQALKEYNIKNSNNPNAAAVTTEELVVPMRYSVNMKESGQLFNFLKNLNLRSSPDDEDINKKAANEMQNIFYDGKEENNVKKVPLYKAFQPVFLESTSEGTKNIVGKTKGARVFTSITNDIPDDKKIIFNGNNYSVEKEKIDYNKKTGATTSGVKYNEYYDPISGKLLDGKNAQVSYRVSDFDYLNSKDFEKKYGVTKEYAQEFIIKMKSNGAKTLIDEDVKFQRTGSNTFLSFDNNESSFTKHSDSNNEFTTYNVRDIIRNQKTTELVSNVFNTMRSKNGYSSSDRSYMTTTTDVFSVDISDKEDFISKLTAYQNDPNNKPDPLTPQARNSLNVKLTYDKENKPTGFNYTTLLEITENLEVMIEGTDKESIFSIINKQSSTGNQQSGMSGQQFKQIFNQ